MTFRFDQPALLLLALTAVPMIVVGWRWLRSMDAVRRVAALGLRVLVIVALAIMLAGPRTVREHDRLTVIGLLDVSGSVRRFADLPPIDELAGGSNLGYLRRWFNEASGTKAPEDRFGLVVFDGQAIAVSVPTERPDGAVDIDVTMAEGTNIGEAVRLGLAMLPADTARRIVLVSDGNETIGSALEAARQAAGGAAGADPSANVPIDILPISYRVKRDVQIVRVEAPAAAQPGQTVTVRVILQATDDTPGRLTLRREGQPVDLNGVEPGYSRPLLVPAGQSVQLAVVELGETPVNRFEAIFEPSEPGADALPDNNRAEAFTATPSKGKTLVVDPGAPGAASYLAQVLDQAGIPHEVRPPGEVPSELLSLQRYDLIVLDNVAAFELSVAQQTLLGRYVHDLGGGLIMIGGENGFGAGGWNGSPLEEVLPLELDPPSELLLPAAALVLVLDKSGSMNKHVAGARATQQQVANEAAALAIESLRADSLVGVIAFDTFAHVRVPLQPNADSGAIAGKVRGITAEGGTRLRPALRRAHEMLAGVQVDKKRVVCLSDGESPTEGLEETVAAMASDDIRLTTIAIGDDADYDTLKRLAEIGGGEFYPVRNPKTLPRVLVDSVQVVNKPLLKEVAFVPQILPTGSSLAAGLDRAPVLEGLVITAPRDDPTVVIEMVHPDGEPLLAHWQAGLGRVAAFTSDAQGHWSRRWLDWPGAAAFWTQLARTIARPAVNLQTELIALIEDDRLLITFEAAGGEAGFLNYLLVDGTVYTPEGKAVPVRLRQTAPGRYEGSVSAVASGNYIVALSPRQGTRRLTPAIGGASKASSPEFRNYESNVGLLEQIMELTRGRRLDLASPGTVDLFDRSGMRRTVSSLPAWRALLWLALALLLLDIACRRIAWDSRQLRALLMRGLARVAPASIRGRAAEATLASLREVSVQVDRRLQSDRAGTGGAPTRPPGRVDESPPTSRTEDAQAGWEPVAARKKRKPDPSKVTAALDSLLGRTPRTANPPEPEKEPEPEKRQPQETTESLLEAKRRAREQLDR